MAHLIATLVLVLSLAHVISSACLVSNCATCPQLGTCTACNGAYFLVNNTCVTSCSGISSSVVYYSSGGQCLPCFSTCANCIDGTSSGCTSCLTSTGFYLLQGSCLASCPTPGYYPSYSPIFGNQCVACTSPCVQCTSGSSCQSCGSSMYLQGSACVSSCGSGTFPVGTGTTGRYCTACFDATNCLNCTDGGSSSCISCKSPTYLQAGACVATSSSTYFLSGSTCISCSSMITGCIQCSSATTCQLCTSGYYFDSLSASCVLVVNCTALIYYQISAPTSNSQRVCGPCTLCNNGYYASTQCSTTVNSVCTPCTSSCGTNTYLTGLCSQTSNTQCQSPASYQVPPYGYAFITTAVSIANAASSTSFSSSTMRNARLLPTGPLGDSHRFDWSPSTH